MKKLWSRLAKRSIAAAMALLMPAASMFPQTAVWAAGSSTVLSNPRKIEATASGQRVTYDCVYFGQYPQSEVTAEDNAYSALAKVPDNKWDENNDTVIDGQKYRRMRSTDATQSKIADSSQNYYYWTNAMDWHYFRYEPVKWRVLRVKGDEALMLSDLVLDDQPYNKTEEAVTWKRSSLRNWLNGNNVDIKNFIDTAFDEDQQDALIATEIEGSDVGEEYSQTGGNATDKVFLLSIVQTYEKNYGFVRDYVNDEARRCKGSDYAKAMGVYSYYDKTDKNSGNCQWYLYHKTLMETSSFIDAVNISGRIINNINAVSSTIIGVRPAVKIKLSESGYSYAGTVCTDGTVKKASAEKQPENPKVKQLESSAMESEQMVSWDSVYFGQYPQSKVVKEDPMYNTLVKIGGWTNNEIEISGTKYRRLKNPYIPDNGKEYYKWDEEEYHYFKYEPIQWRVLEVKDGKALLLSNLVLDARQYDTGYVTVWKNCTLRSWLNAYEADSNSAGINYKTNDQTYNFLDYAFSDTEKNAISQGEADEQDNVDPAEVGKNEEDREELEKSLNTIDKIFLLSASEVCTDEAESYGFAGKGDTNDEARYCKSSTYAQAKGLYSYIGEEGYSRYTGNCNWWLRGRGQTPDSAAYSPQGGGVRFENGTLIANPSKEELKNQVITEPSITGLGVRVALRLDLSAADCYSYAGVICSDGSDTEVSKLPPEVKDPEDDPNPDKPDPNVSLGDVDGNGKIDLSDAQMVLKAALKIISFNEKQTKAADVDKNNKIDLSDAQKILKVALKIETIS